MKKPLEEAAELFRENAAGTKDPEKERLYRGLVLMAESLRRIEKSLADLEAELQEGPNRFYNRAARPIRRRVRAVAPGSNV